MQPFSFTPHGSSAVSVGITAVEVTLKSSNAAQVWIDNRGADDLLVEFFDAPLDADSFRIPGNTSQPLTTPLTGGNWDGKVRLKRPTGAATATVYVASGAGV